MKKILFHRHGQSTANAGKSFTDSATVELTEKGHLEALELSERLSPGDYIIVSMHLRTLQTAQPFINKNPHIPVHTSQFAHEFTYATSSRLVNTDNFNSEIDSFRQWYWCDNCDPFYKDGSDVENFHEFINRIHTFLLSLKQYQGKVDIFSHGHFIRASKLLLENKFNMFKYDLNSSKYKTELQDLMCQYRDCFFEKTFEVHNASTYDFTEQISRYINNY